MKKFKWAVNMSAGVERLRQHVGLESMNIMKIVHTAGESVRRNLASGNEATVDLVQTLLVTGANWGAASCPDVATDSGTTYG